MNDLHVGGPAKTLCRYAILRFQPYRETEEFVNVGVLLLAEASGVLVGKSEHQRHQRITDFFHELKPELVRHGLAQLNRELSEVCGKLKSTEAALPGMSPHGRATFEAMIRPRRTLFFFSEPRVLLSSEPKLALEELYDHYVNRQFAQSREYQEALMRRQLKGDLASWGLSRYYSQNQRVGDAVFGMKLPFVHIFKDTPTIAIKPLNLVRRDSSDIYVHGGQWVANITRLHAKGHLPRRMVFVVSEPDSGNRLDAAKEIQSELVKAGAITADFKDKNRVRELATPEDNEGSRSPLAGLPLDPLLNPARDTNPAN